jgi:hypothetical protein
MAIQMATVTTQAERWFISELRIFGFSDLVKNIGNQRARPIAANTTFEINPSARAFMTETCSVIIKRRIWKQMTSIHIPT